MKKPFKSYFAKEIIKWYHVNKRELPFRETPANPYKVWISEIILQQTQINKGIPFYNKFINKYPTIQALSAANEQDILKIWQGLGYYSRARNLYTTAQIIMQKLHGDFPKNYKDIVKLKGIGPYTAAAISSIVFNEPKVAIDGNGYRFLSRHFGIDACIDNAQGRKVFENIGQKHISLRNPGEFNQAIIEIGAVVCRPKNPSCSSCPVQNTCIAFKSEMIDLLPVRKKKKKPQTRHLYYFYIKDKENCVLMNKRESEGIWRNMYDLPVINSNKKIPLKKVIETDYWQSLFKDYIPQIKSISREMKHILSHQILFVRFFEIEVESLQIFDSYYNRINISKIDNYPISRLLDKFFQQKEVA